MASDASFRTEGPAALLTLYRPGAGNRISESTWGWIIDALAVAAGDRSISVLVISGADGSFSNGRTLASC